MRQHVYISFVAAAFLGVSPVSALACPPVKDSTAAQLALLEQVQQAPNEGAARVLTNQLWELWATAPDDTAQAMLDDGLGRRASFDLNGAKADFTRLIDYCPHYAEGYNQRAFVLFIQGDYDTALVDLEKALELAPTHVAALAGKALTLMGQGHEAQGRAVLRDALKLNPWLPERRMLATPDKPDATDL